VIPGKKYTPKELVAAAWRRRWWIVVPFVMGAIAATAYVLQMPRRYLSTATIQIVSDPVPDSIAKSSSSTKVSDRLSSIGQTALTRTRLEAIIKDIDLYADSRSTKVMELIVERMRGDITFKSTDRDVFVLGYTAPDPRMAHAVATRLTALFIGENTRDRVQRADATTSMLDAQVAEVRKKLDEQERQLEAYKTKYAGELPSQVPVNVQELSGTQLAVRSLADSISRDQDQRLFLQRQLEAAEQTPDVQPAAGTSDRPATAVSDADQLVAARADLKTLEGRLTPEHPDVQRARRNIARLEQLVQQAAAASVAATPSGAPRPNARARELQSQVAVLDRRVASSQDELKRMRAQIDGFSRRISAAPAREAEMATLSRDYDETKKLFSDLVKRQNEANMTSELENNAIGDRFRVIEAARLPEKPSGPSRTNTFAIGLALALGVALGVAGLIEYRDSSLRSEDDITVSLRLPVLATIPDLGRAAKGRTA
jgi:polysaccharide chain length determinant protein (PEP-CTERM system associated)